MAAVVSAERVRSRIDALAGAGLDWRTFGLAAVEALREGLPFAAACLGTSDPATDIVTTSTKWGGLDDHHDTRWSFHEYEVDDVYDFRSLSRSGEVVVDLHAATGGDPARSRRFSELFSPVWDFSDELRAALRSDGATWGGLALFHDGGRAFTAAEQEFVASVAPCLARGLRAGLVAAMAGESTAASGPAVIVVDPADELVSANLGATARLAELGCAEPGTDRVPVLVSSLVAAARRMAAVPGSPVPRARVRTPAGRWLVAHASPLVGRAGAGPDVVVTIDDARGPDVVPLVVASYGLTARERDVVALVLSSAETADIAATLHLSAWTVQDHLKKVFAKVGVRSRRELIARVVADHYLPRAGGPATALTPSGWYGPTPEPA